MEESVENSQSQLHNFTLFHEIVRIYLQLIEILFKRKIQNLRL